jgi:hypothetical protein
MNLKKLILASLLFSVTGCTANHGRYAMLSNRPVKLDLITEEKLEAGTPSWGESTCKTVFLLPVERGCSMNRALAGALNRGDLLVDANLTYEKVDLFPFFIRETWRVSGKAISLQP